MTSTIKLEPIVLVKMQLKGKFLHLNIYRSHAYFSTLEKSKPVPTKLKALVAPPQKLCATLPKNPAQVKSKTSNKR